MSRIGKTIITIPVGVTLENRDGHVVVKGPKGELTLTLPAHFKLEHTATTVEMKAIDSSRGSEHGLYRSLLSNMILGVSEEWSKTLELVGVGYKAQSSGADLTLSVGFSHPVAFKAPSGITFQVNANTKIVVSGIDKKLVGEIAAQIRAARPPEPYKGKGIRYLGEVVRKKAGKAVKAAAGAGGGA